MRAPEPLRDLVCIDCGTAFQVRARRKPKRCAACKLLYSNRVSWLASVRRGKIRKPGVGSGGNQYGADNGSWKGGTGAYRTLLLRLDVPLVCSVCGVDLSAPKRYTRCVHHKDHDRSNNDPSNLVWCCKRCHQMTLHERERDDKGRFGRIKTAELSENLPSGQLEPKAG